MRVSQRKKSHWAIMACAYPKERSSAILSSCAYPQGKKQRKNFPNMQCPIISTILFINGIDHDETLLAFDMSIYNNTSTIKLNNKWNNYSIEFTMFFDNE